MKRLVLILSFILIVSIVNFSAVVYNNQARHAKLDYVPLSLEMHVKDSDLVAVAKVDEVVENINEDGISFTISKVKIKEPLKGNINKNDEILILQTNVIEDPTVEKDETVLLFLEEYQGYLSKYDNTYVIKGLYHGHYKVKDNKIKESLSATSNEKKIIVHDDIDKVMQEIIDIDSKNK